MKNLFIDAVFYLNVARLLILNDVSEAKKKERIPYKFAVEPTLPGMIIFHIDELIWPYKLDSVMIPPMRSTGKHKITDRMGNVYELFPETATILEDLATHWYILGGLIESTDVEKVETIMNLYDIDKHFKLFEVFPRTPGSKIKHITRLSIRAEIPLEDILYFDSNKDDLEEIKDLKVLSVYVDPKEGLTYKHIEEGFYKYYIAKNGSLPYHYNYIKNTTHIVEQYDIDESQT